MTLRFENFEIHPSDRQLWVAGSLVDIGARAFDLLVLLARKPNVVLAKAELMEAIWPHVVFEENNLQVQVYA